jgi:hypothetical protein
MNNKQSAIRSPELTKERISLQRSPMKVGPVLFAEGIKWKTCEMDGA